MPDLEIQMNGNDPRFSVREGVLRGPGVFYCPTAVKFYMRPQHWAYHPVAIVHHFTACHASTRPIVHLSKLLRRADHRLDNEAGAIDALHNRLVRIGSIPDVVSLVLQNAGKPKLSSWCIGVGSDVMDDGHVAVVQYSPNLDTCGTMHAGSPKTWQMRKRRYGKRTWKTSRGETRWDGRRYRWPNVAGPNSARVLTNANPYTIGIEAMNFGRMTTAKRLRYPGRELVKVDGKWYERPSDLQLSTIRGVIAALRTEYDALPVWGHMDLVPWNRSDPWPPYPADY
jgi:hypothetical protein